LEELQMKVSTKGRYGLRIMMELALQHGSGPVLVSTIAENQALPGKYIHVLVGGLKAAGLVRAVRGPNGGLVLAREASRITPLDVVTALEGRLTEGLAPEGAPQEGGDSGVAREVWSDLTRAMEASLSRRTLADLADEERTRSGSAQGYSI
jgi:Rrf2 family cysteine metabolism transcriptional repressor